MDEKKLADAEVKQRLVVNEDNADNSEAGAAVNQASAAVDQASAKIGQANAKTGSTRTSGKPEPALIRIKDLPSRKVKKPETSESRKRTRKSYVVIAILTTIVGIITVPFAWATWTILKYQFPQSAGVQFFLQSQDWATDRVRMLREIEHTSESAAGMPSLLSHYGEELMKHSEFKEALPIYERCQKLTANDPIWSVHTGLQIATCEHQIYLKDRSAELHIDKAKQALALSKTMPAETLRTALLTAVLANMYADIGNFKTADQYFDDADQQLEGAKEQQIRQRQVRADQWRAKMRYMSALARKLPKSPAAKLGTEYGDSWQTPDVVALLKAKKFGELSNVFKEATENRVQHRSGRERIDDLYRRLTGPKGLTDVGWQEHLALLNEWAAAEPKSAIPHVAMADFYNKYAWNARGSGWAKDVRPTQWDLYRDRLHLAAKQLQIALALGSPGPEWFSVAQVNILGLGDKRDIPIYDAITDAGNTLYPDYLPLYLDKVYYLQPRWQGKGMQWVDYATKTADRFGGEAGDKLYARLVAHVDKFYPDIYKAAPPLSKERVSRGNALLDKEFGERKKTQQ